MKYNPTPITFSTDIFERATFKVFKIAFSFLQYFVERESISEISGNLKRRYMY